MRSSWPVVILLGAIVLVGVLAAAALAYDSARSDVIAGGVHAGDVDIGGMTADEARQPLERELAEPAAQGVVAVDEDLTFELSAEAAEVRVDLDRMVDEALEASREGGLVTRVLRDLRGHAVDEEIPLRISYSTEAAGSFARSVAAEVEVEPREAAVEPRTDGLDIVEGREGLSVDAEELHAEVVRRLEDPRRPREVEVPAEAVAPDVTRDDLAERYPQYITVDRAATTLRLFEGLEESRVYEIAVGQHGHDTPAGLYHIENKAVDPAWHAPDRPWAGEFAGEVVPPDSPHNPIVSRWLGFHGGAGIHGTEDLASIGERASRGCIRMTVPDVEELYELVPVGTPIYVG